MEKTDVIEATEENFKKMLAEKDAELKKMQEARKQDLVDRAKALGIEKDLAKVNEDGIKMMIEMAEEEAKAEEVKKDETAADPATETKTEEKLSKGMILQDVSEDYCPEWAKGDIKVQGKDMWREWDYDFFGEAS